MNKKGKCKAFQCGIHGEERAKQIRELIGYSYFNIQMIDNGRVYPTGEREKVPTCLECFLFEKPLMEERMAEEKIRNESLIPYKWFYFYNEEDEMKYPNNWWEIYHKLKVKK